MRIIPPIVKSDGTESVEEYLRKLRDILSGNSGSDTPASVPQDTTTAATTTTAPHRGRGAHPRRARTERSSTPLGGVSSTRAESVQRRKAEGSRPGSRRERRWSNRVALLPTPEDIALDSTPPASSGSVFSRLSSIEEMWQVCEVEEGAGNESAESAVTPAHPGQRVERRLRPLLRRAPEGTVASIENDLVDTFSSDPSSVYLVKCDRWNRAILHAIAGYLGLVSASETVDGQRVTTVSNPHSEFVPPVSRLAERHAMPDAGTVVL
eukprot:m.175316 g.175316  ORF g.175316 m.175316 type:complete len:266 (-) comp13969_c0_seq1:35-832(-)